MQANRLMRPVTAKKAWQRKRLCDPGESRDFAQWFKSQVDLDCPSFDGMNRARRRVVEWLGNPLQSASSLFKLGGISMSKVIFDTFVTGGIEQALTVAKAAAGGKDVSVMGGEHVQLEPTEVIHTNEVIPLRFRVTK